MENHDSRGTSRWHETIGAKRVKIILLVGAAALVIRLLMNWGFEKSALLYVGIPYLLSIAIASVELRDNTEKWWFGYLRHAQAALIVFMASSILLFEGFVCMIMFMPLYFGVMGIGFLIHYAVVASKSRSSVKMHLLPLLLVGALSLEGTHDALSFDRNNRVSVSYLVPLSIDEIKANLAAPIDIDKPRHWFLSFFPMPAKIDAGSLASGDVHTIHTRYNRWFFTNSHEGQMRLLIEDVQPLSVRTRFLDDTSYFASYLTMLGTEIVFEPVAGLQTRITLHMDYQRELDPAWYFQPLQRFGMEKMARLLVEEIMIRDNPYARLP